MEQKQTKTVKTELSQLENDLPYQTVSDSNLTTTSKTVVGAINETKTASNELGAILDLINGEVL